MRNATFPVFAVTFKGRRDERADNHGQRAGPEFAGERVELFRQRLGQLFGLVHAFNQQGQRLMAGARFYLIHAIDGAQIKWVGGEAIEGVRGHAEHFAGTNLVRRIADE